MPEGRLPEHLRQDVTRREGGCCEYCASQARYSPAPFSVEHIVPRSRGGGSDLSNLALACQGCKNLKYACVEALDPVTGERVALCHPRRDAWHSHFTWSDDSSVILGLTATGRATVFRLELNREPLVNLRRVLSEAREHPPARFVRRAGEAD